MHCTASVAPTVFLRYSSCQFIATPGNNHFSFCCVPGQNHVLQFAAPRLLCCTNCCALGMDGRGGVGLLRKGVAQTRVASPRTLPPRGGVQAACQVGGLDAALTLSAAITYRQ